MAKIINGYFHIDNQDIDRAIKATGAEHHYVFGGYYHVYTSKPLTQEQQDEYEKTANECISKMSKEISKEIDAEILKNILLK